MVAAADLAEDLGIPGALVSIAEDVPVISRRHSTLSLANIVRHSLGLCTAILRPFVSLSAKMIVFVPRWHSALSLTVIVCHCLRGLHSNLAAIAVAFPTVIKGPAPRW